MQSRWAFGSHTFRQQGGNHSMNPSTWSAARTFIYRNARPLDLARWQYHFEGGRKEAVLDALQHYQNSDGGFGHALEPDAWNPISTPMQTWAATEVLREIDFWDREHPLVQGTLRYLMSGRDFDGQLWYNSVRSNRDFPHAPWWEVTEDSTAGDNENPTACLAGFLIRVAKPDSAAFALGTRLAREAAARLAEGERQHEMHTLACYVRLYEYLLTAGVKDAVDLPALEGMLRGLIRQSIIQDQRLWDGGYVCLPSRFIDSTQSPFLDENRALVAAEAEWLANTQLPDGSWRIPWCWGAYPEAWAVSETWWKGSIAVQNMRLIKRFGSN